MGFVDIFAVLCVFAGFFYLIAARIYKRNPEGLQRFIEWIKKEKTKEDKLENGIQQIYHEKREIL